MRDWYLRQAPRDRVIVLIVGALALFSALYLFVWDPLQVSLDKKRNAIAGYEKNIEFIRTGGEKLQANTGGVAAIKQSDKAPYLLIDEIIRTTGVSLPQRLEPDGNDGARVQFSEVEFDKLILVLAELETYGLVVKTLNVSGRESGLVTARLNMERS